MKRFYLPKSARLSCVFLGTLAVCVAGNLDATYHDRVNKLPALVNERGYVAPVEIAMSGLDSYADAKKFRTFSVISLAIGALFFGCFAISTSKKVNP